MGIHAMTENGNEGLGMTPRDLFESTSFGFRRVAPLRRQRSASGSSVAGWGLNAPFKGVQTPSIIFGVLRQGRGRFRGFETKLPQQPPGLRPPPNPPKSALPIPGHQRPLEGGAKFGGPDMRDTP